jgi:hypothetical protein
MVYIRDVANVHDGNAPQTNIVHVNGNRSVLMSVLKNGTTSTLSIVDGIREKLDGMRFLDWPTYSDKTAVHEGLQAMMTLTMESGARLCGVLDDPETARLCLEAASRLKTHTPDPSGRKSPAALLSIAGFREAAEVSSKVLKKDGTKDLGTFYGFYVLNALAKSGDFDTGMDFISRYWGGMLDVGATTFWEDFDLAWTENAGRIDELVPAGKKDLHGDFGA